MSEEGPHLDLRPAALPPAQRSWLGPDGPPDDVQFLPGPPPSWALPATGVVLGVGVGLALLFNALLEHAAARAGLPTTRERLLMGPCLAVLCLLFGSGSGLLLARAGMARAAHAAGRWREGLYLGPDRLLLVFRGRCHLVPRAAVLEVASVTQRSGGNAVAVPRLTFQGPGGRPLWLDLPLAAWLRPLEAWRTSRQR